MASFRNKPARESVVSPSTNKREEHIVWLDERIARLHTDLTHTLRTCSAWREKDDLLEGIPGVGPITRASVLALLPELGALTGKQIAALAGVAPFNRDGGKHQGQRIIWADVPRCGACRT